MFEHIFFVQLPSNFFNICPCNAITDLRFYSSIIVNLLWLLKKDFCIVTEMARICDPFFHAAL